MHSIKKKPIDLLGYNFIPEEFLHKSKKEYHLRNLQNIAGYKYRNLTAPEKEALINNRNSADNWNNILVTNLFDPGLIRDCRFYGLVRIGNLENIFLEFHDLQVPVGLYNSTIISCDIGSNSAINNVKHLSRYILGKEVILQNVDEMLTTNHAKFGNGIIKDGEKEEIRIWLEVGNENGGRKILPFDEMLPGDAYLWSKYRSDSELMTRFKEMTDKMFSPERGYYGYIGDRTVIKSCRILKDVKTGTDAYIKGANKLKNLTIKSSADSHTQIGEGVELVNGIIGYGCRVFYGVKAIRFILGSNSTLKYGARLINSFLGDNSTISCCEVLNTLIFPGHEQHHNNSFLCASTIMGQSNIAAGASIGSNHNSRGNDGEIAAGRGFWPGLCSNFKHNCKFASFTLIAKGTYPAELHIPLPFSLVSNNETDGELTLIPAYWFIYNMYALARNSWKYDNRDQRPYKRQVLEFDYLAPDTIEEVFTALSLLEKWTALAFYKPIDDNSNYSDIELKNKGRTLLTSSPEKVEKLNVFALNIEASKRPVRILKTEQAYSVYREIINYYGIKTLILFIKTKKISSLRELKKSIASGKRESWINLGGQLISESRFKKLINAIKSQKIPSWEKLHSEYSVIGNQYSEEKTYHAYYSLLEVNNITSADLSIKIWSTLLKKADNTNRLIAENTFSSREKDYLKPFNQITYLTNEERNAVIEPLEDNSFILQIKEKTKKISRDILKYGKLKD